MVRHGTGMSLAIVAALLTIPAASDAQAQQAAMERIKRSGTITVCADPDRLPYSSQKLSPAGFDIDVSQEIAKELGFKLAYTWHSTHRGTKIVRQLADAGCDFFPGFPVDGSFEENNFKVILSKPFYSSGFATLTRADASDTILQDSKTKGVGVQMGTLPDFKLFNRGYERKLFRNTTEMIDALKHKEIDAAVVPALEGGWEVKSSGDTSLKVLANTEKDFVFPIAIGFAKADKELRDLVNGAIAKIESDGRMAAIFEKYGMVKLAGTGGGEPPKSKEELEKDDDGPPKTDKKAEAAPAAPAPKRRPKQPVLCPRLQRLKHLRQRLRKRKPPKPTRRRPKLQSQTVRPLRLLFPRQAKIWAQTTMVLHFHLHGASIQKRSKISLLTTNLSIPAASSISRLATSATGRMACRVALFPICESTPPKPITMKCSWSFRPGGLNSACQLGTII